MVLKTVRNKLLYEMDKARRAKNLRAAQTSTPWQSVATMDETLERLLTTDCSLCRYGDGEYKVMAGMSNGFQKEDTRLAQRLRQVLKSNVPGLLVCIPNIRQDMDLRTDTARRFWNDFVGKYGADFSKMLLQDKEYGNAHVTRLYMDYQACGKSSGWFQKLRQLWAGKELLIVEGEQTRLGTGNDLFSGVKSIRRILCPSKSAFSHYDEILDMVKALWNGELVLIALGQTATVLAHDLHLDGIRALDIGHIDIEYEWFLAGATEKTAISGKFVKEVDNQLQSECPPEYLAQIAAKVGV